MDVKQKVFETIKKHDLLQNGMHIVLGLSGGPDSVCLFDVLCEIACEMNLTIHPVHVNHKFRPGAAEEDQEYVEALCRQRGLVCRSFVVDCNQLAREEGLTSEEAGRKARYEAFIKTAAEIAGHAARARNTDSAEQASFGKDAGAVGCANPTARGGGAAAVAAQEKIVIAVAQNANDQAETILFRVLRGTGTDGLAGIAYKRYEGDVPVIRPLLDVTREEIENYCEARNLSPRIDHTNKEAIYARNKIRLELLPYLAENFNANIIETIDRLGRNAACDKEFLNEEAERALAATLVREGDACEESGKRKDGDLREGGGTRGDNGAREAKAVREGDGEREGERKHDGVEAEAEREIFASKIKSLHRAVRMRVYNKVLTGIGMTENITEAQLSAVERVLFSESPSAACDLADGYRAAKVYDRLRFYKTAEIQEEKRYRMQFLSAEAFAEQSGASARQTVSARTAANARADGAVGIDDASMYGANMPVSARTGGEGETAVKVRGVFGLTKSEAESVCIRTRRDGDRIAIRQKDGRKSKKLQDFFVDVKLPKIDRDEIELLACGNRILWILPSERFESVQLREKGRFSADFAVNGETETVLLLEIL